MPRFLLLPLVLVLFAPAALAQPALDPEASSPYIWRVVIEAKPHPLLSPAFRASLRRDLLAALQPAIGPLGTVEVVDPDDVPTAGRDPLWQQFREKGFAALDAPRDLTGVKTHFLRIEVRDGAYHLETRQHDGFTGLASPLVRRQTVRAPELVGRAAGLMIDRDFGLAGTVEAIEGKPDEVRVRFRGGKLGPLDRVVREGDVFAVARVSKTSRPAPPPVRTATGKLVVPPPGSVPPAALTSAVRDFTYLKVIEAPADGSARCAVFTRYQAAFTAAAAVVGYRCLKLTTVLAPVSVRLVGGDGTAATTAVATVRVSDSGFGSAADARDFLDFRDGLYRTGRPHAGVACVTVGLGATRESRFPVPVLSTDPVTLQFEVDAKAEERALFERAVLGVAARASDARTAQVACFDAVAKLTAARKNADALARARAGHAAADASDKVLSEEIQQLKGQGEKAPGAADLLTGVDRQLAALRDTNTRLATHVRELEKVVDQQNDKTNTAREVRAQELAAQINLLVSAGEIDEALGAYDQLATLLPDDADVKARRAKLAAEWKPKDDAHAKARDYLLKTWPALATVADLKESLPQLRVAVEACKKAGDRLAFRRFAGILGGFPAKLTDLVKDLDPNAAADLKALQDAMAAREVVGKLEQEVVEFLKAAP